MDVLIVGGTPAHRGGVEAFCERAIEALGCVPGWQVDHLPSQSAYLRPAGLPAYRAMETMFPGRDGNGA